MKKLVVFVLGTAFGFVLAHFVNKDPRGRSALAEVDGRVSAFLDRAAEAFRQHESRLVATADAAKDALD